MNIKLNLLAVAALSMCAMCFTSCNKENPQEQKYASVDFGLKITEVRHSKTFEWDVNGNAVHIDVAEQELQELWITKWNTTTVTAHPLAQGFEGVNYSSSDPKKVKVTKVDEQSCTLEYMADTDNGAPVTITAKAGDCVHSFRVFSKEVIRLEGIHFYIDGAEKFMKLRSVCGYCLDDDRVELNQGPKAADWKEVTLTIGKLEPENASFRYVVEQYRGSSNDVNGQKDNFLENKTTKKDFSYYQGMTGPMKTNVRDIAIIFSFNTETLKPENKKTKEAAIGICFDKID